MNFHRREALKAGGGLGLVSLLSSLGLLSPATAQAEWQRAAFEAKTLPQALAALGAKPLESREVVIVASEIAENGAVVPVKALSRLANTESIAILVEKNPNPLAGHYQFSPGTEAVIDTRLKLSETSAVIALVKADGKFYMAKKDIKVTIGGCGG